MDKIFLRTHSENAKKIIKDVVKACNYQPPLPFLELYNDNVFISVIHIL